MKVFIEVYMDNRSVFIIVYNSKILKFLILEIFSYFHILRYALIGAKTLSLTTLSITKFSIMTLNMTSNITCHSA
jgi:hypothetical protein